MNALEELINELKSPDVKLTYVHKTGRGVGECNSIYWSMEDAVENLLEKHNKQIRDELNQMAAAINKEIEKI